jgi:DNA topoisomerase-1
MAPRKTTRAKTSENSSEAPDTPVRAKRARRAVDPGVDGDASGNGGTPPAKSTRAKASKTGKSASPRPKRAKSDEPAATGKSLVIVESPTKSRTLTKFLGRGFTVMASNGHIMDLPKSKLGVDVDNDFEPEYVPIRTKNQALAKIRTAAQTAERIFLAPDPDREGEAIAWHLSETLKSMRRPLRRLTFNEITQRAVQQALQQPRDIDMNLVNAQQARRVLDRLVGYKVSPFVWRTVRYGLSAGRVQSVAVRLICEREEEIQAFVPVEYWTIEVDYETTRGERFTARLVRVGKDDLEQGQLRGENAGDSARQLAAELLADARITEVDRSPRQVHPRAPFITSTLQQTAVNRLGFTAKRTMSIAQQLYEGVKLGADGNVGLITYMRTDSPRLAGEAIASIREWLTTKLGPEYVPESPRQFKSRKAAQDAHEAIRPSAMERTPELVRPYLSDEQFKLYDLIWKRAMASQAASAEYLATTFDIESGRLGLRASGRVLKFAGFQKLYGIDEEDDASESQLPDVEAGEALRVASAPDLREQPGVAGAPDEDAQPIRPVQHFTEPPPRYTEASLVRQLEEENIGRPSTYATIVDTIITRGYVERQGRALAPTDLGMAVNRLLVDTFPDVFNVGFTAGMEEELDDIEEGKREWQHVVRDLWNPLSKDLEHAEKARAHLKKKVEEVTNIACPNDGAMLVKKFGRRGPFLACPNYPECKYTRPVDEGEMPVPVEGTCPKCGSGLVARMGPFGRFIACSRRPDCDFTKPFTLGITCPECGQGEIAERRSKRGKTFYGCTRYPDCTFAVWDRPRTTACPSCGAPFMVEKQTRKGLILRCLECKHTIEVEPASA